ncbi:hypothetical protein AB0269_08745 [Microbacterium sp. NPDC077644]|uniref:hypothetical protein n=1 Tax=Microbacterium sp. NPDC077644 TaxID=3155055 RepID=UPI00344ECE84
MLVTLHDIMRRWRDGHREPDDRGATLVVVIIVMMVLMVGAVLVGGLVTNTASSVVSSRSTAQSRAAADAGLADAIARASRADADPCAAVPAGTSPAYTVAVACDSPNTGQVTFSVTGTAGGSSTTIIAVYETVPVTAPRGLTGALVAGTGGLSTSTVRIDAAGADGDVIVENGSLNCNSATTINGSVIVRNGSAAITNYCKVTGNVYASKDVSLDSFANVGGDVVSLGTLTTSNSTYIAGSAFARGKVILNNSTQIKGNLTTEAGVSIDKARVDGDIRAGGVLAFNSSFVGGDASSSYTGGTHGVVFRAEFGSVHVAVPFSSFQESKIGGILVSAPPIGAAPSTPKVSAPAPLQPDGFAWFDLGFEKSKWEGLGYSVVNWTGDCDMATAGSALKSAVIGYNSPTVVNALACKDNKKVTGVVKGYNVTLDIKTDIAIIANEFSTQQLKVNSASGAELDFSLITPDNTANNAPTCASGQGTLNIYAAQLGSKITGLAYSPCQITIGQGTWNGQIYGGTLSAGGATWAHTYKPVTVPGSIAGDETGGVGSTILGTLIAQRDVQ